MKSAPIPDRLPSGRPWPRITVVTPTFNRGDMLDTTIRSVLGQRYPDLEYIVMDGGSTDNTVEVIKRYSDHIAYWESEKDRGQSHALNKGFARSTGELLTWLNSDDKFEPDALFALALAQDMSGADMVAGMIHILRNGTPDGFHITSAAETNLLLSEMLDVDGTWNGGKFFYQPEVIFTRDIWMKSGGYVDENLHLSMDYDLWCRMAAVGARLKVIGRPICAFLIHPDQKTLGSAVASFKTELKAGARELSRRYGILPRYRRFGSALPRICLVAGIGRRYGAEFAVRRVASTLMTAGHDVHVVSLDAPLVDGGTEARRPKISEVMEQIQAVAPDVVIFGDIHGAGMPPAVVAEVGKQFLTLLLPNDLWWLTGRSTFPLETRDPLTSEEEDLRDWATYPRTLPGHVRQLRAEKARVLSSPHSPVVLANSRWTQDAYRRSLRVMGSRTRTIRVSLGVPGTFKPHDRAQCREEFGLPGEKFVVATAASDLNEARKGLPILLEAVRLIGDPDVVVACAGQKPWPPLEESFQTFCIGPVDDEGKMSRFYATADVFVSASQMETLGQTLIEASASGVPTIAFAGSGTEDAIRDGVNGVLVNKITATALADAIRDLKANVRLRRDMAFWAALFAENEFSIYKSYYSLYRAFEDVGLYAAGQFRRQIGFVQEVTKGVRVDAIGYGLSIEDHSGISEKQQPYAPLNIGAYRWVRGNESSLGIYNGAGEIDAKVIFCLRNSHRGQTLRVTYNGVACLDRKLPPDFQRKQFLEIDVCVPPGRSRLQLSLTKVKPGSDGLPQAVLLEDFLIVPQPADASR
jgi:glycosyltransferase involved in cell wall biosynthesis